VGRREDTPARVHPVGRRDPRDGARGRGKGARKVGGAGGPQGAGRAYDAPMAWARRRYRGNKVYVEVDDATGAPVLDDRGFAKLRYKPEDPRTYTVRPTEVLPVEAEAEAGAGDAAPAGPRWARGPGTRRSTKKAAPQAAASAEAPDPIAPEPAPDLDGARQPPPEEESGEEPGDDIPALAGLAIHAYTDGASLGNPGPSGAGVVLIFRENRKEVSLYLGDTTNNVAELTAVLEALRRVKRRELPVRVHSDSTYVIGVLDGSMRAKANAELVARIREEMRGFKNLRFVKVPAHAGNEQNERADALAGEAAKKKRSRES